MVARPENGTTSKTASAKYRIILLMVLVLLSFSLSWAHHPEVYHPQKFEFTGTWIGYGYSCKGDILQEKVNISVYNGHLVATKLTGDYCVPAGNITFQGKVPYYTSIGSYFPVTWTTGSPHYPASYRTVKNLKILSYDSFTSFGVTFKRVYGAGNSYQYYW